jgi:hypothetical protein
MLSLRGSFLIQRTRSNRFFNLTNRLGDLDFSRAGVGTVEYGMAAIYPELIIQDLQSFRGSPITAVEDEPVRVHDCSWTDVFFICPEGWTRGCAASTKNTLGRVIKAFAFFLALNPFTLGGILVIDKIWLYRA